MTAEEYTILLIRSVIQETAPPIKNEKISFEELFSFARKQKVENLCFAAIEKLVSKPDEDIMNRWSRKCSSNHAQAIIQDHEKKVLAAAFQEEEIPFLPVKGWHLREMYPKSEYRFMSDIDILIHDYDRKKARDIMQRHGYNYVFFDNGYEDSYVKKPYLHVELHRDLAVQRYEHWFDYYHDIWEKAYINQGCEYYLSWSDFYIYFIVHFAKDFTKKGSGIRSVIDAYLFLKLHENDLDRTYITAELKYLGVIRFEKELVRISAKWFDEGLIDVTDKVEHMLLGGGVYGISGVSEQRFLKELLKDKDTGIINIIILAFHRAFPGLKRMRYKYDVLDRLPILLPFFWILRWIKHRKRMMRELKALKTLKRKNKDSN